MPILRNIYSRLYIDIDRYVYTGLEESHFEFSEGKAFFICFSPPSFVLPHGIFSSSSHWNVYLCISVNGLLGPSFAYLTIYVLFVLDSFVGWWNCVASLKALDLNLGRFRGNAKVVREMFSWPIDLMLVLVLFQTGIPHSKKVESETILNGSDFLN